MTCTLYSYVSSYYQSSLNLLQKEVLLFLYVFKHLKRHVDRKVK